MKFSVRNILPVKKFFFDNQIINAVPYISESKRTKLRNRLLIFRIFVFYQIIPSLSENSDIRRRTNFKY